MDDKIHVEWDGPLTFEQVVMLKNHEDKGIYQIYGDHPIYGTNVLLYIGRAIDQKFGERIVLNKDCHEDFFHLNRPEFQNINIYVGRLAGYKEIEDDEW